VTSIFWLRIWEKEAVEGEKKKKISWALVAHVCNPSYSGGRDQEDHSSRPAQANNL
jgi:hypothetical protein